MHLHVKLELRVPANFGRASKDSPVDVTTLFFVEASLLFLFSLTMVVNSVGQSGQRGNYWFAASNFCGGVGLFLASAYPMAPFLSIVVLANLLLFLELTFINK